MGKITNASTVLVGKPEEKRRPQRCRCRWENNIKNESYEIIVSVDSTDMAPGRDQ
jgi:hypothetical protein